MEQQFRFTQTPRPSRVADDTRAFLKRLQRFKSRFSRIAAAVFLLLAADGLFDLVRLLCGGPETAFPRLHKVAQFMLQHKDLNALFALSATLTLLAMLSLLYAEFIIFRRFYCTEKCRPDGLTFLLSDIEAMADHVAVLSEAVQAQANLHDLELLPAGHPIKALSDILLDIQKHSTAEQFAAICEDSSKLAQELGAEAAVQFLVQSLRQFHGETTLVH